MNTSWFRNYVVILVFGVLYASAVSADDGATKTRWSDLAPEVRAEITAIRAKVVKLEAGHQWFRQFSVRFVRDLAFRNSNCYPSCAYLELKQPSPKKIPPHGTGLGFFSVPVVYGKAPS